MRKGKKTQSDKQSTQSVPTSQPLSRHHLNQQENKLSDLNADNERYFDLIRNDPIISEKSKTHYLTVLRTLLKETNGRGIEWVLLNAEEAMECIMARFERLIAQRQQQNRNTDDVSPSLSVSPQSALAFCAAVSAVIKRLDDDWRQSLGGDVVLRRHWDRCVSELSAKVREKYDSWRASDRQRDNFVPWESLISRREQLASDPKTYNSNAHLLLAFLTYMPPMRTSNYGQMRLYDESVQRLPRHAKARQEIESQRWNYVQLFKSRGTITVQDYKTANHYHRLHKLAQSNPHENDKNEENDAMITADTDLHNGVDKLVGLFDTRKKTRVSSASKSSSSSVAIKNGGVLVRAPFAVGPMVVPKGFYDDKAPKRVGEMPPQLFELLTESVRLRPRSWVFVNRSGQPFNGSSFLKYVSKLMRKIFHGKAMSVDLVRHAATNWLDEHHRHNHVVLTYFRYWMMHGKDMQGEYVLAHNIINDDDAKAADEAFR